MTGTMLGIGDTLMSKTHMFLALMKLSCVVQVRETCQIAICVNMYHKWCKC